MAKLTKNQKLWLEQSTNILARINRLKQHGIDVDNIPKPPKRPETITSKQLIKLAEIDETIKSFEKRLLEEDETQIRARIKRNLEEDKIKRRKIEQAEISTGYHSIVWELFEGIEDALARAELSNGKGTHLLREFVDMLKETYGPITTAAIFYNAYKQGIRLTSEILYDSDGTKATPFISQITNFIKDKEDFPIFKDKVLQLFDYYDTLEFSELDEEQEL